MQREIVSAAHFLEIAGANVNPFLSVLLKYGAGGIGIILSDWTGGANPRAIDGADYIEELVRHLPNEMLDQFRNGQERLILLQAEDNPCRIPGLAWQGKDEWDDVVLVPDLYYFRAGGYSDFQPHAKAWNEREPKLIWRGSTTGILGLTQENIINLPRYWACRAAKSFPQSADVRFSAVVQATTAEEERNLVELLEGEELIGEFIAMEAMAGYKYILDIDGNANSWNFTARLLLGSCMLRVESVWKQWFSHRIRPWEHYVPVAADLSDFEQRLAWCRANDAEAQAIAERGRAFALAMSYEDEMSQAARKLIVR